MWENSIWNEMRRMQEEMDAVFDGFFGSHPNRKMIDGPNNKNLPTKNYRNPLADIMETESAYIATLELPGIDKKDINISINDNTLEVKVEKKNEKENKEKGMYKMERSYSGFYRCFSLPNNTIKEKVDAKYENGILRIKIPKNKKKNSIRQIEVK